MGYSVTLVGWRGASAGDVERAVAQFRHHLDGALGAKLPQVYRAWLAARSQSHDLPAKDWPAEVRAAISRWEEPFDKASAQGLVGLQGKGSEPWFDVVLADGP